jgi:hypothetical protein
VKNTNNYVIINNRAYNPVTGLPVDGVDVRQATASAPVASPSTANRGVARVHKTAQHSKTLSRRYVKKPMTLQPVDKQPSEPIVAAYSPVNLQQLSSQKAEAVQKFAPTAAPTTAEPQAKRVDLPAQKHPVAHRATASSNTAALQRQRTTAQQKQSLDMRVQQPHAAQPKELKSSAVLKNEAILEAMNREMAPQKNVRAKKHRSQGRWSRFVGMATASLAIVMLAGYFTYLNMPNLNMRMAAIQSGIDARYPGYSPDGYALNGPIQFKDGEVAMKFAYADGSQGFTLTQQKSSWDSSAVKQYVDSQNPSAIATQIDGLTIYSYGGNAAWVNGGILYTVNGNAPLSNEQIQRIATSI